VDTAIAAVSGQEPGCIRAMGSCSMEDGRRGAVRAGAALIPDVSWCHWINPCCKCPPGRRPKRGSRWRAPGRRWRAPRRSLRLPCLRGECLARGPLATHQGGGDCQPLSAHMAPTPASSGAAHGRQDHGGCTPLRARRDEARARAARLASEVEQLQFLVDEAHAKREARAEDAKTGSGGDGGGGGVRGAPGAATAGTAAEDAAALRGAVGRLQQEVAGGRGGCRVAGTEALQGDGRA
jgi:hypothetical protein